MPAGSSQPDETSLPEDSTSESDPQHLETLVPDRGSSDPVENISAATFIGDTADQDSADADRHLLLSGYRGLEERLAEIPKSGLPRVFQALERIIQLYEETEKPDEVMKWSMRLETFRSANGL
jgi:hypothetical protein